MIKVNVKRQNNKVYEIVIKGHAEYDDYGTDIVCAAVSSMAITTVNGIISLDESVDYEENNGFLKIRLNQVLYTIIKTPWFSTVSFLNSKMFGFYKADLYT